MNNEINIPIESSEGVTIYGMMIDVKTRRLGQFTVYSDRSGISGPYTSYKDAENRFKALSKPVRSNEPSETPSKSF